MAKRWEYYQPNDLDLKDEYGDCTIRALSKVFDVSWIDAYEMTVPITRKYQILPNFFFYAKHSDTIADTLGLQRGKITNKRGTTRPTVDEFAKSHPNGTYLLKVAHHVVACVNGKYYDTWDCGYKPLYGYFERTV